MGLVFDAARARAAGLVQLPRSVQGAACENCQYFRYEPQARDRSIGYCSHFRMTMNVLADWHCDMWKRPDAPLASPPGRQGGMGIGRRFAKAGDPDDCGHDPSGSFDRENECASGGSKDRKLAFESSFSSVQPDRNHLYHATTTANLHDILESGHLRTFRPHYGTPDQREWPDGNRERRSYWIATPAHAESFVPEGGKPVLLRVRRSPSFRSEKYTGDFYVNKIIPTKYLQALLSGGKWVGLDRLKREVDSKRYRFVRSLVQRYSRAAMGSVSSDAPLSDGGSFRAATGSRTRASAIGVSCQCADGDLAPIPAHIRRFAHAGDSDDCGHERHGGLFTPKNTCAAGGSGRREDTPAWSPLGDESDRRLIDAAKRLADAYAAAQEPRKSSLPPPTVMSPEPFEPDEPIRWRIANLPGAREMMAKIVQEVPHYRDRLKKSEEELAKYNVSLTANLRRNEKAMYAGTLSEEDYRVQTQLQAGIDRLKDEIDSIREKVSMIVDAAIDARGKNVKLRSVDGVTPFANAWDERDIGRRRSEAYLWFQNKLSGSGSIRVRWNAFLGTGRAGATVSGSTPSIDVDYDSSGTRTYIHEMGHVLDQSVDGIGKAAVEFLRYRTMHTPDRPMNEIYPHENPEDNEYEDNEIGNEDHFGKLHKRAGYIGKKYPGDENITEIVSMGLQFLYDDPVHFIETDPEYATFILGILDGRLRSP